MSKHRAYWGRQVVALDSSGLSRAEFCRRRGLNYQTMSGWVKRLAEEADGCVGHGRSQAYECDEDGEAATNGEVLTDGHAMSFVELPIPAREAAGYETPSYEVVLDRPASRSYRRRSIRFGVDFDADVLTRLIRTIESC